MRNDLPKLLLLPSLLLLLAPRRSSDDSSLSDPAFSRLGLSLILVFPATPAGRGGGRRSNPLPPRPDLPPPPPLPPADRPLRPLPVASGGLPGPRRLAGMGGIMFGCHNICEGIDNRQMSGFLVRLNDMVYRRQNEAIGCAEIR